MYEWSTHEFISFLLKKIEILEQKKTWDVEWITDSFKGTPDLPTYLIFFLFFGFVTEFSVAIHIFIARELDSVEILDGRGKLIWSSTPKRFFTMTWELVNQI